MHYKKGYLNCIVPIQLMHANGNKKDDIVQSMARDRVYKHHSNLQYM